MPKKREEGIGDAAVLLWIQHNLREHFWKTKSHIIVDAHGYEWGPHPTLKQCVVDAIICRNHARARRGR